MDNNSVNLHTGGFRELQVLWKIRFGSGRRLNDRLRNRVRQLLGCRFFMLHRRRIAVPAVIIAGSAGYLFEFRIICFLVEDFFFVQLVF